MATRRRTRGAGSSYEDTVELGNGVVVPRDFTATVSWSGDAEFDVVARVHVADDGTPALVGADFRAAAGLPLARLTKEFRWSWLLEHVMSLYALGPAGVDTTLPAVTAVKRRSRRPPTLGEDHYRRIAELYRAYPGRDVIRHIAEVEGREYATVRRWVAEARAANYLEATTPGRRSTPTPKAKTTKTKKAKSQ